MLLTRSPLYSRSCPRFLVRLACVRHAASVDSEPGSNSRLKPDACRRVVGRRNPAVGFWPLAKPKARAKPKPGSPLSPSKGGVAHLVRSFRLMPESISHDWHVQPSCQRPSRQPPERGVQSSSESGPCLRSGGQPRRLSLHESDCPRNLTNIPCGAKCCQQASSQVFQTFSTLGSHPSLRDVIPNRAEDPVRNLLFGGTRHRLQRATVRSSARHWFSPTAMRKTRN